MQITNDAFYYLYFGEEPLDEDNFEEAEEISGMFPNGFYIEDNWKAVEDSDLIEATFIPYVDDKVDYDEYQDLTRNYQLQIKWVGPNRVKMWAFNKQNGTRELRGEYEVHTANGKSYFHTGPPGTEFIPGKASLFFLKHFSKK